MPCYRVPMKGGGTAFLCGNLGDHCSSEKCADVSGFLCDYPVGEGKTCDLPLCESHAYEVAPNIHYCYGHFAMWIKFAGGDKVNEVLEGIQPFTGALVDLKRENEMLKERIRKLIETKPAPILPLKPR